MPKILTDAQIDAYHRDGFLAPVDIFTEDEAAELRAELEVAEARWPEAFDGAARNNAHLNIMCLDRIVHEPRLLDAMEDLLGPNLLNYGTVLFIKEPQDPGFVSWHQDARYMGLEPYSGVTAWVALSPATQESGCMMMIPGSHDRLRDHEDTYGETNILTRGQEVQDVDESLAVATELRPGQASFHSATVIHASQPNRSNDRRIGFVIQSYMPPDVRQVIKPTGAQLVRGEDTHGNFYRLGRPTRDMDPEDVRMRDKVNAEWSDILYHGAEKRRNY
ncbi:phytanoyl-CoA dioxygenase family protein [Roseovarius faecimaris]|uniref:Phytanoyl-CoA dioxygenase family protein n=1 Tax=Roseovarius faecimaris TaxID=2494550 RepID=A0A6I6IQR1_9RHOB|nr:phytanoyl-CoA dioxygenase family protein [Roseovarius faecimaris]QGX98203.1 phytanoyl-CoA dioxygenase family protein [Roseovarius faecimaris]